MPMMQLDTATAERVLEALVRSCDKTVERNGHMTGGFAHPASTAPLRRNHRCTCHILSEPIDKSACRREGGPRIEILGCASVLSPDRLIAGAARCSPPHRVGPAAPAHEQRRRTAAWARSR